MNKEVCLGYTTMTHGIKGELKFYAQLIEFSKLNILEIPVLINGEIHHITKLRAHQNHYLIELDHLTNINLVEQFRNQKIYAFKEDLGLAYLVTDLIGYEVYEKTELLGKVSEIRYNNGGVLLQVNSSFYIPYLDNFIDKVIIEETKIIVKNTKGLI